MLPCTTKRRITTNLKSINNHKCQKIKLHGALTTKELKKQSTRPTRLVRQTNRENLRQGCGPHGRGWLNGKLRLRADCGLCGVGVVRVAPIGETSSLTPGFLGKWASARHVSCIVLSLAPPPQAARSAARRIAPPQRIPKAPPPYNLSHVHQDKEIGPKRKNRAKLQKES